MSVACSHCGRDLGGVEERAAAISVFVMGDERIDSWYSCDVCKRWTVEEYYDAFMGDATVSVRGPISWEAGQRAVAIIRRCPTPLDKWCDCAAHKEYDLL